MAGGISNSLNAMYGRISSIENDFAKLQSISFAAQNSLEAISSAPKKSEFQNILEEKINEIENKPVFDEIEDEAPKIKEAINLKSKIDLKAQKTDIDEIIETFSLKYDVDSDLIKAIIKQESGFNKNAKSAKGALGLMQLMPKTAQSLGIQNALDPTQNIEGGVKYLRSLLNRFDNNEKLALAAYNAGPAAVKRYGGIPPYKETQNYVKSIMNTYNKVKEAGL